MSDLNSPYVTHTTRTTSSNQATAHTTLDPRVTVLKVASDSRPASVAGAIAGAFRRGPVVADAAGPHAVNVAIKATAIARGFLAPGGVDLVCKPFFNTNEDSCSVMRLQFFDLAKA